MANLYPENTTYKSVVDTVRSVGRAATAAKKSAKSFNTQQYSNIGNTLSNVGNSVSGAVSSGLNKLKTLGSITTPYGGSTNYESFHPGIDIANKIGTPIQAYSGGTVIEEQSGKKQGDSGFGNTVVVQDAQGNKWRYSHLSGEYVKIGQKIAPGTTLGLMGNSGSTYSTSGGTGSHLDLRIKNMYNQYINPSSLI